MSSALYLVIFTASACFMASRVYLLIVKGRLNVKGVVYSRHQTPIAYWITLVCAIFGMAFMFVMIAASTFAIIHGR